MTVRELIAELQKQDPSLEVLTGDNDHWFYSTRRVRTAYVMEGREIFDKSDEGLCLVIEP